MSAYVLIHGAGNDSWYWHRVTPLLVDRGHEVVTMDLPCGDESAGLAQYTDVVLDAIGDRGELIVVGQSLGGFVAPLVATRRPVELLVLLNGMIPRPGETDWWAATGHPVEIGPDFDPFELFLHDVPDDVRAESGAHAGPQAGKPMSEPYPLKRWPDVPTRFVMSREDRFFPPDWQRGVVRADRAGRDRRRALRRAEPSARARRQAGRAAAHARAIARALQLTYPYALRRRTGVRERPGRAAKPGGAMARIESVRRAIAVVLE